MNILLKEWSEYFWIQKFDDNAFDKLSCQQHKEVKVEVEDEDEKMLLVFRLKLAYPI